MADKILKVLLSKRAEVDGCFMHLQSEESSMNYVINPNNCVLNISLVFGKNTFTEITEDTDQNDDYAYFFTDHNNKLESNFSSLCMKADNETKTVTLNLECTSTGKLKYATNLKIGKRNVGDDL